MDTEVREYAVRCIEKMTDEELSRYLFSLVQAVRFERCYDNALARFLLYRSLLNKDIGNNYFWYLRVS